MRDPHIHAEKTPVPGFGHAAISGSSKDKDETRRELIFI